MANYNVDIEVAVKGQPKIKSLQRELTQLQNAVDKFNKPIDATPFVTQAKRQKAMMEELIKKQKELKILEEETAAQFTRNMHARRAEMLRTVRLEIAERKKLEAIAAERQRGMGQYAVAIGPQPDRLGMLRKKAQEERLKLSSQIAFNTKFELALATQLVGKDKERNLIQEKIKDLGQVLIANEQALAAQKERSIAADKKVLDLQRQQRRQRIGSAISSAAIGGGFPLLFGQGGAGSIGGALGGLAGGAIGGGFGFALSIVGTALGQAIADAEKFDKALAAVNAKARDLGSAAQASAKDVQNLAKSLGITKDEALKLVAAFSAFESFADKQALVAIFGDDAAAFNRLAAAQKEFDLAKEIFATRDDIGIGETKRLLNMLKIQDASVVELALAEARLQAEHDIAVEQAKQVTFMDRLNAAVVTAGMAGLGGGVIDPAEFGKERAEKLEQQFQENSKKFLETFAEKVKQVRDLLGDVKFFEPGKPLTAAESGDSIEQSLRKQLARYEEIDPLARKRAMVEADHKVTLEKIAKIKDDIKRKDLEILAGQLKQARLSDIEAQKADKRLREQLNAANTRAGFEMRLATAQAGLPGAFDGPFGGSQRTAFLGQQQIDLDLQAKDFEIQDAVDRGLTERAEKLKAAREQYVLYETQILEATVAQEKFNEALALTQPVTDSLFNSLISVAEGTKTAEQAFADFLRSIADMLFTAAKQMIAQYIAIGIARTFAGVPAGGGGSAVSAGAYGDMSVAGPGFFSGGMIPEFANGGRPPVGRPSIVGERGPELFVPDRAGTIVPNHAMGSANVTVNVDASGSSVEGDSNQAGQLGKAIGLAVQQELLKQKRPGGLLAGV